MPPNTDSLRNLVRSIYGLKSEEAVDSAVREILSDKATPFTEDFRRRSTTPKVLPSPLPSDAQYSAAASKPMPRRTPEEAEMLATYNARVGGDHRPTAMFNADVNHFKQGVSGTMQNVGTLLSGLHQKHTARYTDENNDPWQGPVTPPTRHLELEIGEVEDVKPKMQARRAKR